MALLPRSFALVALLRRFFGAFCGVGLLLWVAMTMMVAEMMNPLAKVNTFCKRPAWSDLVSIRTWMETLRILLETMKPYFSFVDKDYQPALSC